MLATPALASPGVPLVELFFQFGEGVGFDASLHQDRVDRFEQGEDLVEVFDPVVFVAGAGIVAGADGFEVAGGDGAGAEDDVGVDRIQATGELEADDGIEDGLDGDVVGKAEDGFAEDGGGKTLPRDSRGHARVRGGHGGLPALLVVDAAVGVAACGEATGVAALRGGCAGAHALASGQEIGSRR